MPCRTPDIGLPVFGRSHARAPHLILGGTTVLADPWQHSSPPRCQPNDVLQVCVLTAPFPGRSACCVDLQVAAARRDPEHSHDRPALSEQGAHPKAACGMSSTHPPQPEGSGPPRQPAPDNLTAFEQLFKALPSDMSAMLLSSLKEQLLARKAPPAGAASGPPHPKGPPAAGGRAAEGGPYTASPCAVAAQQHLP